MEKIITQIINEWDPIDLLFHAPKDEYKSEIAEVINLAGKVNDEDLLAEGITKIFISYFGADTFTYKMQNESIIIAKKILDKKREFKSK